MKRLLRPCNALRKITITASFALLMTGNPCLASEQLLSLLGGYTGASSVTTRGDQPQRINIDAGNGFTLAWNSLQQERAPNIRIEYEFIAAHNTLHPQLPSEDGSRQQISLDVQHLHIGGLYQWQHTPHLASYFGGTLGVTRMSIASGDSELDPSIAFALGLKIPLGERILARIEVRIYGVMWDSDSAIFCSTGGGLESGVCQFFINADLWWHQQLNAGLSFKF